MQGYVLEEKHVRFGQVLLQVGLFLVGQLLVGVADRLELTLSQDVVLHAHVLFGVDVVADDGQRADGPNLGHPRGAGLLARGHQPVAGREGMRVGMSVDRLDRADQLDHLGGRVDAAHCAAAGGEVQQHLPGATVVTGNRQGVLDRFVAGHFAGVPGVPALVVGGQRSVDLDYRDIAEALEQVQADPLLGHAVDRVNPVVVPVFLVVAAGGLSLDVEAVVFLEPVENIEGFTGAQPQKCFWHGGLLLVVAAGLGRRVG
ncbi:hypothetical protein D3C85_802160 [compost metagenome]